MDWLTSHLNYKTGNAYHSSLSAAMKLARNKINHYYSLTDSSNIYCIAMVLHPGMKLEYFCNQKWEEEWIEQAENLVHEEYILSYEKVPEETNAMPTENTDADNDSGYALFGNLFVTTCPRESEIQEYLSLPVENVKNPLKWWENNKHIYPSLHRIALDYISIPGTFYTRVSTFFAINLIIMNLATSTSVECVFSQGCHLLPFTRNGLLPSSIRAFLCFGSWACCGLLIFSDVVDAVSQRSNAA